MTASLASPLPCGRYTNPPFPRLLSFSVPCSRFCRDFAASIFYNKKRFLLLRPFYLCAVYDMCISSFYRAESSFPRRSAKSTAAGCLPCFVVLSFMRAPCRGLCRPLRRRCRVLEKRPRIGSVFRCRFPGFNQILRIPGLFLNGVLRYTMGAARAKPWIARQRQNRTEGLCKRFWSVTTSATL